MPDTVSPSPPAATPIVRVALDQPRASTFDYLCPADLCPAVGQLVAVPFGRSARVGIVCELAEHSEVPAGRLRALEAVCEAWTPLGADWIALIAFAASYYQRCFGEVALPALPPALRDPKRWPRLSRRRIIHVLTPAGTSCLLDALPTRATALRRLAAALHDGPLSDAQASTLHARAKAILAEWAAAGWVGSEPEREPAAGYACGPAPAQLSDGRPGTAADPDDAPRLPHLTDEQQAAFEAIDATPGFDAFLLFGITGSGKTEVYLRAVAARLARDPQAQALLLVPEINLTPQFESRLKARFAALGPDAVVSLHSGLAEAERGDNWLAAHSGRARIVIGTRLSVLASFKRLAIIVVDEEHDPAYKQQEGLRYSARDLCVWRAKQLGIPVVLGSATPSLESWCQATHGRYRRLDLTRRPAAESARLPTVATIDLEQEKRRGRLSVDGLSQPLLEGLRARLARGEQSLLFLNRRGYAPVLSCDACGWVSGCERCSAYLVLHRGDGVLRCHHCSWQEPIPHHCPACGNVDLKPLGRGTQRIEEALAAVLPEARVLRIDADSTRRRGSAEALFSEMHEGRVDILVGTNMVAKGHDFQRVTLVGVLNADSALFSHDFRASERLFGQLMQVAGRAGRADLPGEVLIQTRYPSHPLYAALARHDYSGYAQTLLDERREGHLPPFIHQAVLRAEARTLEQALGFLSEAARQWDTLPVVAAGQVVRYEPVPLALVKIANTFRAQLLLESASRHALHTALAAWRPLLDGRQVLRYAVEVDPLEI